MTAETYRVRNFGPLHHLWHDTQPKQSHGMIEEEWRLGPFTIERRYVREDKGYGSWLASLNICWRDWRGPWLSIAFGTGAQDWDAEDKWWRNGD